MKKNKTYAAVFVILVFSGIIGFTSYFRGVKEGNGIRIENFPKTIGQWKSVDISLDDRVYQLLETDNLIMREYKDPQGQVINLYIIYSLTNRKVVHAPEMCLQGDGGTIVDKSSVSIDDSFSAVKMLLEKKFSRELVVYWFRIAGINTSNLLKQQFKMALNQIRGKRTSIALVRVITNIENNNDAEALNRIKSFCSLLIPLLPEYVP
jgi:EpsI family protein